MEHEPAIFREIEELSRLMGMKPRSWEQLQGRTQFPSKGLLPSLFDGI